MPTTLARQAELPIRSKLNDAESTPTESVVDSMSHPPCDRVIEERTMGEQISIQGKEIQRCSGMVQKQGQSLSTCAITAKDIISVQAENEKLKKDLYALKRENDNLLSMVKSQAKELLFCGMPPKDSIEAKAKKLTRRLNDIQLRNAELGRRLENFFFGFMKPASEEVGRLIEEVSSWDDGYRLRSYEVSSSKLGATSAANNAGDEEPTSSGVFEPTNNPLTIRTALAEEVLDCAKFGPIPLIPFIEIRKMITTQASPPFHDTQAETSPAASEGFPDEETPTAELDAAPAVAYASPLTETSTFGMEPFLMPYDLQAPPTLDIQKVEPAPALESDPALDAINTPLPSSPPLSPYPDQTEDAMELGEENEVKRETTTLQLIREIQNEIGNLPWERRHPWNSASLLVLLSIVLCCINGGV
ncbi:hypothetical protein N431DRAFT_457803 [Stipitochalara longipes BDJ]|nr:hypothetical protein N431DRAFT_457803 [Stipitochalara longipes BDJ]